jgi:asparagine N-glycosylation enzyme membrane subunit Stt3
MVRLMLTLTPVVCVLSAIAFSKIFDIYLKDETKKPTAEEIEEKERNEKYYDKVGYELHVFIFNHTGTLASLAVFYGIDLL